MTRGRVVDRRTLLLGGGALTAAALARIAPLLAQEDTVPGRVVDTSSGGVRGLTQRDVHVFKGISLRRTDGRRESLQATA